MKNALILHGTDFDKTLDQRNGNWFPWLKKEFEKEGYEVFLPELPQAWEPNTERYWGFLKNKFDFNKESVLVGHSSAPAAILGILERLPDNVKVDKCVFVGSFLYDRDWGCEGLFEKPFAWEKIKKKADKFFVIHSDDDPYCPLSDAEEIAKNLGIKVILKKGQKHFSVSSYGKKYKKFPLVLELVEVK